MGIRTTLREAGLRAGLRPKEISMKRSRYFLMCLTSGGLLLQAGCITDLITLVAPLIL